MKKIKITESQYKRLLSEIDGVNFNRVDKTFVKTFKGADVKKLKPNSSMMEDENGTPFNIKDPMPNVANSKMKKRPEPQSPIHEDIFSPEFHQAIHNVIQNIWMNPSQRGLDRVFVENGVTWGDIISYLTSVGITAGVGAGIYKVTNFFKTKFSPDPKEAMQQKMQDIEKLTKIVEKDPDAPWNQGEETTYQKKQRMQAKPESGFEAKPKPFKPFKPGLSEDEPDEHNQWTPQTSRRDREPEPQRSTSKQIFKPAGMGKELAVLNGPDGMYIFDYTNHSRNELPNPDFDLDLDDIADFINDNLQTLSKGEGVQSFEQGDDLVKIDEKLKEYLSQLYAKDGQFIKLLNRLEETGASSAGAFTGAFSAGKPQVSPGYSPAEIINDEDIIYGKKISEYGKHQKMSAKITSKVSQSVNRGKKQVDNLRSSDYEKDRTRINYPFKNDDLPLDKFLKTKAKGNIEETMDACGTPQSSSSGQYTQPKVWAKNKANWAASKRTQYPHGEMVEFDPCTKLNNNKSAQNGKCSQGSVDNVVKTHTTPQSVISKTVYEEVAKRTGKTLEEVKRIIQTKKNKG
jgi:hypothetical protein